MRPQRDLPPEWAERMVALGFQHNGRPSARRLADAADVTIGAALRVIHRENFGEATAVALGKALRDEDFVARWVGMSAGGEYVPPLASRRLTARQRVLLDELIRELTQEGGQTHGDGTPDQKIASGAPTPGGPTPIRPAVLPHAARSGESRGKIEHDRAKERGQETQDDGGFGPA